MVDAGTTIAGQGTQTTGVISKAGSPLANLSFAERGAILRNAMQPPPIDIQAQQNAIQFAKFQAAQAQPRPSFELARVTPADVESARSSVGLESIPQSPPMSNPLTQPKQYTVNLSESLGLAEGGAKPPPVPSGNTIIGYASGVDQSGARYQTPIFVRVQAPQADIPDPFSNESTKSLSNTIKNENPDVTNYLNTPEGKSALLDFAKTNAQNQLIDFDNKLIEYHNNSILPTNQLIEQQNINAKTNNAIAKLANFDIQQKNSVIENANSVIRGNNAIDRLANGDITQRNQLIQQQNINSAEQNAIGKLAIRSFVENAAKSGVKSFDILGPSMIGGAFGSQGVKLGTTTPEKALDDLQSFQQKGIPVSLSYQPVQKQSSGPFDVLKSEIKGSPLGRYAQGFLAGIGATNARTEVEQPFTGLSSSIKEGSTNLVPTISPFATQTYQPPAKIDSGFFSSKLLTQTPEYVTGGLLGAGIVGGLQVGAPGAGKAIGIVSDLLKSPATKGILEDIAKGASRGETTIAPQIEKISPDVFHITQGTEGRSITPTQKFQKIMDIFRLPTSKEVPGFGTVSTEEGKVGAREALQPKITQPIGNIQGEAEIGNVFVTTGKNGVVTYIPKTISEEVKPTTVIFDKNVNPELQTRLGLTPVEGNENLLIGKLTPETRLVLREAESTGRVTKIGQGFSFPLSDVRKSPDLYAALAKNPSLLGEEGIAVQEKIFPDITRPDVTAIYQTENKGFEAGKGLNVYKGIQYGSKGEDYLIGNYANLNFKPIINPETGLTETLRGFGSEKPPRQSKGKSTNFGGEFTTSTPQKIGAGAAGKANALINQPKTENVLKDLFKTTTSQKEEKIGDYLGFAPQIQRGRTRETQETEIIAFPPGTKSELIGKQIGLQGLKLENDILQNTKEKQAQATRASTLSRLSSELSQRQKETNLLRTLNISGQKESQQSRQGLRIDVGSLLGQRQGEKQIQTGIHGLSFKQTLIQNPLQTERTGLQQVQQQEQLPQLLQLTKLIPLIPTIPGNTGKPPKIGLDFGGGFNIPQGTAGGKRRKTGRGIKSYFAYSVNPNIVGAIEQAGLPGLQTSGSSSIYGKVDKQLQRATRLNFKGTKIRF